MGILQGEGRTLGERYFVIVRTSDLGRDTIDIVRVRVDALNSRRPSSHQTNRTVAQSDFPWKVVQVGSRSFRTGSLKVKVGPYRGGHLSIKITDTEAQEEHCAEITLHLLDLS